MLGKNKTDPLEDLSRNRIILKGILKKQEQRV